MSKNMIFNSLPMYIKFFKKMVSKIKYIDHPKRSSRIDEGKAGQH